MLIILVKFNAREFHFELMCLRTTPAMVNDVCSVNICEAFSMPYGWPDGESGSEFVIGYEPGRGLFALTIRH